MIFYSHASETHYREEDFVLSLALKVRVFGTRKWVKFHWRKKKSNSKLRKYSELQVRPELMTLRVLDWML